jgi:hypothetical protein
VPADPVERLAVLAPVLARLPASGGGTVLDALAGRTPALSRALLSSAARRALRPGPARSARAQPGAGRFGAILTAAGQCPPPCREYVPRVEGDRGFAVKALRARMAALAPEGRRCQPVDMVALGKRIGEAVDPTVARPLVVDRVLGTLPGIKSLGPVEIQPELDLPLWSFLARRAPDWLLPGIGRLPDNRVLALATNPAFVEAMLAGANCQALSELRWRNLPIVSGWSPMRKFWQRKGGEMDIQPIGSWPDGAGLGGAGLQPAGVGVEAVILFRTSLFRRYPGTAVFLYRDESGDWEAPPDKAALEPARKIFPIFTGSAGDDIVFFGFPVAPAALKRHWVVLEEPPSGYRFYTEDPDGNRYHDGLYPDGRAVGASALDAANFAYETFATPVRVMIGALLEDL